jgi:hypothetical protein
MRRREFIAGIGGTAAWMFRARAQQPMPTVAFVAARSEHTSLYAANAFRKGLGETGPVHSRVPLAGRSVRSAACADGRSGSGVAWPSAPLPAIPSSRPKRRQRRSRSSSTSAQTLSKLVLSRASPGRAVTSAASIISPWRCRQSGWSSCMGWCLMRPAWPFLLIRPMGPSTKR